MKHLMKHLNLNKNRFSAICLCSITAFVLGFLEPVQCALAQGSGTDTNDTSFGDGIGSGDATNVDTGSSSEDGLSAGGTERGGNNSALGSASGANNSSAPASAPIVLEKEGPRYDYTKVNPPTRFSPPPYEVYGSPQYGAPAQYGYGSPLWSGYHNQGQNPSPGAPSYGTSGYAQGQSSPPSYGGPTYANPQQSPAPSSAEYGAQPEQPSWQSNSYPSYGGGAFGGGGAGPVASAPTGLVIPITLRTAISTQVAKEGDFIEAAIAQNVSLGGMAYIPAGSVVTGQISESTPGRRLSRSGSLTIQFNQLDIANGGPQIPISAHLLGEIGKYKQDASGEMHGETWKAKLGQFALRSVIGAGLGAGLGTGLGAIADGGYGAGRGAWGGAAIGGGLGAGDMLLRKGRDVLIRSGTQMRLQLDEPISIPASSNLAGQFPSQQGAL